MKTMEREVKTSWKDLLRAFISSDSELEKQEDEEEIKFNKKYSKILSQSRSDISSLEAMLEHPDVKVRGQGKRTQRSKTRKTKTRELAMENRTQQVQEDKEIER